MLLFGSDSNHLKHFGLGLFDSIRGRIETASIASALQYDSGAIRTLQAELLAALYPDAEDPGSMDVSNLRSTVYQYLAKAERISRKSRHDKEH